MSGRNVSVRLWPVCVLFLLILSHGLFFVSILKGEGSIEWSRHVELSVWLITAHA